jgi:hypothetical protein
MRLRILRNGYEMVYEENVNLRRSLRESARENRMLSNNMFEFDV